MLSLERAAGVCPVKRPFLEALAVWGRRLDDAGIRGSLAYRFALGFVISAHGSDLRKLAEGDLLFLEPREPSSNSWTVKGAGEPSVAWWTLATAFADRGSAIFAFLAEEEKWARAALRAGAPRVSRAAEGVSAAAIVEIEAGLGRGNAVALDGIGAMALGSTADDAGLELLRLLGKG